MRDGEVLLNETPCQSYPVLGLQNTLCATPDRLWPLSEVVLIVPSVRNVARHDIGLRNFRPRAQGNAGHAVPDGWLPDVEFPEEPLMVDCDRIVHMLSIAQHMVVLKQSPILIRLGIFPTHRDPNHVLANAEVPQLEELSSERTAEYIQSHGESFVNRVHRPICSDVVVAFRALAAGMRGVQEMPDKVPDVLRPKVQIERSVVLVLMLRAHDENQVGCVRCELEHFLGVLGHLRSRQQLLYQFRCL